MVSRSTKIARAGVIACLYVSLTLAFQPIGYGPIQARISECLCILPLFYAEAIPALFIGCIIANIFGGGIYDILLGSLATLLAATATYLIGKAIKKDGKILKPLFGSLPPVLFNAAIIPVVLILCGIAEYTYWVQFALIAGGEALVIIPFGMLLYHLIRMFRKKNTAGFL